MESNIAEKGTVREELHVLTPCGLQLFFYLAAGG